MKIIQWIKICLENFLEKIFFTPNEKNGMRNMNNHITHLNTLFAEKKEEIKACEKQIKKIRRTVRIRRIKGLFTFFNTKKKAEEDRYPKEKETFFEKIFLVSSTIKVVFSDFFRFSIRF